MNTKHVTSLEISKQLAEAGIVIESEFVWVLDTRKRKPASIHLDGTAVTVITSGYVTKYPAPIATEILERLPENVTIISHINDGRLIGGNMAVHGDVRVLNNSLPDALALLLIRLTKDGLI